MQTIGSPLLWLVFAGVVVAALLLIVPARGWR